MKLLLQRETYTNTTTIGRLYLDGVFQCFTLEDKVRPSGIYIYGETAIPAGKYAVTWGKSPRFGFFTPRLLDVPGFQGILIHVGNYAKDTHGCILLGLDKHADWIGSSGPAIKKVYPLIEKACKSTTSPVTIEVRNK